jgi:E3 ubiquitin-protein ligase UBR4
LQSMLDELSDFSPLETVERTEKGEVSVLCFIFFTLLLKNYQNLSSDTAGLKENSQIQLSSSESLNDSAAHHMAENVCMLLNQSHLFDYLLTYVTNLASRFSKIDAEASNAGDLASLSASSTSCGSLLVIRNEYASGSFSPFFSNSYAKARNGDLFFDFHRVLLESSFRLAYYLVKLEKNDSLKETKDVFGNDKTVEWSVTEAVNGCAYHLTAKLKDWEDILCYYLNNSDTTFIRKYLRRLLLQSCGNKELYHNVRDNWLFASELKVIGCSFLCICMCLCM